MSCQKPPFSIEAVVPGYLSGRSPGERGATAGVKCPSLLIHEASVWSHGDPLVPLSWPVARIKIVINPTKIVICAIRERAELYADYYECD